MSAFYDILADLFDENIEGLPSLGRTMNNAFIVASKFIELAITTNDTTELIDDITDILDKDTFAYALYMALIHHYAEWAVECEHVSNDCIHSILTSVLPLFDQNVLEQQPNVLEIAYLDLLEHYENDKVSESYQRVQQTMNTILHNPNTPVAV
jgi:hypothetical protein